MDINDHWKCRVCHRNFVGDEPMASRNKSDDEPICIDCDQGKDAACVCTALMEAYANVKAERDEARARLMELQGEHELLRTNIGWTQRRKIKEQEVLLQNYRTEHDGEVRGLFERLAQYALEYGVKNSEFASNEQVRDYIIECLDEYRRVRSQIDQLAECIMVDVPGEPSASEGAVECAMRLLRKHASNQDPTTTPTHCPEAM